jgi:hypothetical protein
MRVLGTRDGNMIKSGWLRLGIIISIVWLFTASSYIIIDINNDKDEFITNVYDSTHDKQWKVVGQESEYSICKSVSTEQPINSISDIKTTCKPKVVSISSLVFIPLILFWLICTFSFKSIQWIRNGEFRT